MRLVKNGDGSWSLQNLSETELIFLSRITRLARQQLASEVEICPLSWGKELNFSLEQLLAASDCHALEDLFSRKQENELLLRGEAFYDTSPASKSQE